MSITTERAAEVLREMASEVDPDFVVPEYDAALKAGAAALSEVERLRRELAELRKPVNEWKKYTQPSDHTLLSVCLGDIAMSPDISDGDKAVIDAAIRVVKRDAALSKPVEVLPVEVEAAMTALTTEAAQPNYDSEIIDAKRDDLRAAILKALTEREGGK